MDVSAEARCATALLRGNIIIIIIREDNIFFSMLDCLWYLICPGTWLERLEWIVLSVFQRFWLSRLLVEGH